MKNHGRTNKNGRPYCGRFGKFFSTPFRITPTVKMPAVKHLSTEENVVIETHYFHGLTATEIAKLSDSHRTKILRYLRASRLKLAVSNYPKLKYVSERRWAKYFYTLPFVKKIFPTIQKSLSLDIGVCIIQIAPPKNPYHGLIKQNANVNMTEIPKKIKKWALKNLC